MRIPQLRAPITLFRSINLRDNINQGILSHLHRSPFIVALQYCDYAEKKKIFSFDKSDQIRKALENRKDKLKVTEKKLRLRGEEIVRDIKYQKEVTEQKIRAKKEYIIQDIIVTKAKVRERFEEVIERENIYTIPNILCVARITLSPYLAYVIVQEQYHFALGLWLFAGVTDLLDGWIARTWKSQSSKLGSFLDPLADKVLVGTLFMSLTWQQLIPLPLTLLIIARDCVLVTAAFVIRYRSLPPPRTLNRYFDATHATAQLAPTFISKVNTAVQLLLVGSTLAAPVLGYVEHPGLQALWGVTAASTVASALSYVFGKNTYRFITKSR